MIDISFKRSLLLFSVLLLVLELIIYRDFIFGEYYFLYKDLGDDSYTSSYPALYSKIETLKLKEIPTWSFHNALGENEYPFWLDPIALTITFLFFKADVAAAMIWIQFLYSFLAGIFFFTFLRGFKFHFLSSTIFSCLFVFSGYMLIHSTWMHLLFSNTIMTFSFLLFSWQRFLLNKQWGYIPIAVMLIGIGNPVNIYMGAILLTILMLLQLHAYYDGFWKKWLIDAAKLVFLGLIGIGLSCFMLLSNLNLMLNSPRGSGTYSNPNLGNLPTAFQISSFTELKTSILRLFSPNLEGIADGYTGWTNYFEAPIWYSGLIVLILIPQLFHFLSRKEKLIYAASLLLFLVITLFPSFRLFIWFYSGNYYREISLIFCIIALIYSCKAFDFIIQKKVVFIKTLFITTTSLILLLILMKKNITNDASPSLVVILFFLLIYTGLIWYWKSQNNNAIKLLTGFIGLEILLFASVTLGERRIITSNDIRPGIGYQDATINAISDIKEKDSGFYRVEKDYFSSISRSVTYNEAKIQNYYGSRSYNSFNNINYINFLNSIDELGPNNETSTRWVNGISGSLDAMRLCSVKYFLTKTDNLENFKNDFEKQNENRDVKTYSLKNTLPFGFTYDTYIDKEDFKELEKTEKQSLLLNTIVLDKAILPTKDYIKEYKSLTNNITNQRDTLSNLIFTSNTISSIINSKKSQILFFSIPFDNGWSLSIDGENTKLNIVFEGLMGTFISEGIHSIKLKFEDSKKSTGIIISLVSLLLYLVGFIFLSLKKKSFNAR